MKDAQHWIQTLRLQKHPEGGYSRETYRAAPPINGRAASTAIYFLLPAEEISALHRLKSDELWHFYAGSPLTIHILDPDGRCTAKTIGPGSFQAVAPAGHCFGATVQREYARVGCTVAPGFDFRDFELADRAMLLR